MNSILDLLPSDAFVMRGSSFVKVTSTDVVAGDIVRISIGNKVPADLRLLSSSGDIRFDRSMITGEAEEVEGAIDSTDQNFLESRNISFMGTMVVNGSAVGIVVLTGKNSVMGRIAQATSGVEDEPTLIQREITRFVRIIVCLTAFLAILYVYLPAVFRDKANVAQVVSHLGRLAASRSQGLLVCHRHAEQRHGMRRRIHPGRHASWGRIDTYDGSASHEECQRLAKRTLYCRDSGMCQRHLL
jgi:magnesium-transporting ATPase (P-type)